MFARFSPTVRRALGKSKARREEGELRPTRAWRARGPNVVLSRPARPDRPAGSIHRRGSLVADAAARGAARRAQQGAQAWTSSYAETTTRHRVANGNREVLLVNSLFGARSPAQEELLSMRTRLRLIRRYYRDRYALVDRSVDRDTWVEVDGPPSRSINVQVEAKDPPSRRINLKYEILAPAAMKDAPNECPICTHTDQCEPPVKIAKLECGHTMCVGCIAKWAAKTNPYCATTCPFCRAPIDLPLLSSEARISTRSLRAYRHDLHATLERYTLQAAHGLLAAFQPY